MKRTIVCQFFLYALAVFALSWFCTSCIPAESASARSEKELRLVAYNVGVFSKYNEDSMPDVASMMMELGADAMALCELDSCNRRHDRYQLKDFCDSLGVGWDFRYGSAMQWSGGAYGIGVITAMPISDDCKIALPIGAGHEPRACMVVETAAYVMAAVHLDHKNEEVRMAQARIVTENLRERYGRSRKPVFLCGDFNAVPDSPTLKQLSEDWTILSETAPTYPADSPRICIDYILALNNRARYKVLNTAVCTQLESVDVHTASDHLPVYVDVAIGRR